MSWPATFTSGCLNLTDGAGGYDEPENVGIVMDSLNRAHIIIEEWGYSPFAIFYTRSNAQNSVFSPLERIANGSDASLKLISDSNPIIVYSGIEYPRDIYIADSNSSWIPTNISQTSHHDTLTSNTNRAFDLTASGNVTIAYYANEGGGDNEIFVIQDILGGSYEPSGDDAIPGFELTYILVAFLGTLLIYSFHRRKFAKYL